MSHSENKVRAAVAEEAVAWYLANRDSPDADQRSQFSQWLRASPVHVEEYLGISQLAGDLPAAAADPEHSVEALVAQARADAGADIHQLVQPQRSARRAYGHRRWQPVAAAAALVLAVFGLRWWSGSNQPVSQPLANSIQFATRRGEQRTQALPDATILRLNTDTMVSVNYTAGERRIVIERGEALFEVHHDSARPFRVIAGSAETVDLGTKFNVYLQAGATVVTVVEGRVSVNPSATGTASPAAPSGAAAPAAAVQLAAGQRLEMVDGKPTSAPVAVDPQQATAWLRREVVFDREPLEQVAAEFNRYNATPIEIRSPALRSLAISGVFAADDTASFVTFLRSLDGVHVDVTGTSIRVLKK
jgi:transmembrane sensor